ncbi:MAG: hypothetical protein RLZZ419_566 [Pseudomonadota bacterium]
MQSKIIRSRVFIFSLALFLGGCAKTQLSNINVIDITGLAKPNHILILPFTGNDQTVVISSANKKDKIIQDINVALADKLTEKIKAIDLMPMEVTPDKQPAIGDIIISGHWTKIEEGNPLIQQVIGLGFGQTVTESKVSILTTGIDGRTQEIINFSAHADSGYMPGKGPAGFIINAVKGHKSVVAGQASEIADKITSELSTYFAKQGWIKAPK